MVCSLKNKLGMAERIVKALESFMVSYGMVILLYVLISGMGVFDPITNQGALRLLCICFVIAVCHFLLGFFEIKCFGLYLALFFGVEVLVVLFMGFAVFQFFDLNLRFFLFLGLMLVAVFAGTYLIAFTKDFKKIQEINEIIKENRKL